MKAQFENLHNHLYNNTLSDTILANTELGEALNTVGLELTFILQKATDMINENRAKLVMRIVIDINNK